MNIKNQLKTVIKLIHLLSVFVKAFQKREIGVFWLAYL